jgi:penicillin-binding protein 2
MLRDRRVLALASAVALIFFTAADAKAARRRKAASSTRKTSRPAAPPALIVPVSASAKDLAVGEACRRGLGSVRGSVVAMDPYSGRVITVLNPHLAIESAYQPCSVFKVVVAIAGLSEGVITPDSIHNCDGGCWLWPGHGPINLRRALAVSCNPYFQWVGQQLGYEKVQRYAQVLGLGAPSGINLDGEVPGRLPLSVRPTEVAYLSSHAKGVATSALQLGVLLSAAINGGIVYQPQLSPAENFVPHERWRLPQGTVLGGLTEGFLSAVNEGSAATAFDPDISVAGKTGTCAGVGWFASYAPAERPEVVIVVFVRPGSGHLASTVAGRIYQDLYKPSLPGTAAGGR